MSLPGVLALGSALASAVSIWGPASCAFVLSKASKESVNMWTTIRELLIVRLPFQRRQAH